MNDYNYVVEKVSETLVRAGTTFSADKKEIYCNAIEKEKNLKAKWAMQMILQNAEIAEKNLSPLCDDTGIPHLILELGDDCAISSKMLEAILQGVKLGLRKLPGRPMAIIGNEEERIQQSKGLDEDPGALECAPIQIKSVKGNRIKLHVLMLGGGPAIRGKTYRVFHKHNIENVIKEIVSWGSEGAKMLGCTPCTIAVGIGRSQYEATALMIQAMAEGDYRKQNEIESIITKEINEINVGPIGLGGATTVLATFLKIGPQRASGVRIVCIRPCCCFEPRIATVDLSEN